MEDRKLFKLLFVSWIVLEVCICVCLGGFLSFLILVLKLGSAWFSHGLCLTPAISCDT